MFNRTKLDARRLDLKTKKAALIGDFLDDEEKKGLDIPKEEVPDVPPKGEKLTPVRTLPGGPKLRGEVEEEYTPMSAEEIEAKRKEQEKGKPIPPVVPTEEVEEGKAEVPPTFRNVMKDLLKHETPEGKKEQAQLEKYGPPENIKSVIDTLEPFQKQLAEADEATAKAIIERSSLPDMLKDRAKNLFESRTSSDGIKTEQLALNLLGARSRKQVQEAEEWLRDTEKGQAYMNKAFEMYRTRRVMNMLSNTILAMEGHAVIDQPRGDPRPTKEQRVEKKRIEGLVELLNDKRITGPEFDDAKRTGKTADEVIAGWAIPKKENIQQKVEREYREEEARRRKGEAVKLNMKKASGLHLIPTGERERQYLYSSKLNMQKMAGDITEIGIDESGWYTDDRMNEILQLWAEYSGGRAFPEVMPTNPQDLEWFSQFPELVKATMECAAEAIHREVWTELGRRGAAIDEKMVPLMMYLWENDINTTSSCQGDPGEESYIMFDTEQDLKKFLSLIPLPTYTIGGTIVKFPQEVLSTFRGESIANILNMRKTAEGDVTGPGGENWEYEWTSGPSPTKDEPQKRKHRFPFHNRPSGYTPGEGDQGNLHDIGPLGGQQDMNYLATIIESMTKTADNDLFSTYSFDNDGKWLTYTLFKKAYSKFRPGDIVVQYGKIAADCQTYRRRFGSVKKARKSLINVLGPILSSVVSGPTSDDSLHDLQKGAPPGGTYGPRTGPYDQQPWQGNRDGFDAKKPPRTRTKRKFIPHMDTPDDEGSGFLGGTTMGENIKEDKKGAMPIVETPEERAAVIEQPPIKPINKDPKRPFTPKKRYDKPEQNLSNPPGYSGEDSSGFDKERILLSMKKKK